MCGLWERGTRGSGRGWEDSFNTWGDYRIMGECKTLMKRDVRKWKKNYVLGA